MHLLGFKGRPFGKQRSDSLVAENTSKLTSLMPPRNLQYIYFQPGYPRFMAPRSHPCVFMCNSGLGTAAQKRDGKMTLSEESCTHLIPDSNKSLTAEINPCADSNLSSAVVLTVGASRYFLISSLLFGC